MACASDGHRIVIVKDNDYCNGLRNPAKHCERPSDLRFTKLRLQTVKT